MVSKVQGRDLADKIPEIPE